jgi:ankyrin repeat protein
MSEEIEAKNVRGKQGLMLYLLGTTGYDSEADRVSCASKDLYNDEQVAEGTAKAQLGPKQRTRLMYRAKKGDIRRVKFLSEVGARVYIGDKDGRTALHHAAEWGQCEMVRWLYTTGVPLTISDKLGWTALMLASREGDIRLVRWLCTNGAHLDQQSVHGESALSIACKGGHSSQMRRRAVVRFLCWSGASLDLQDKAGWTALMVASYNGYLHIVVTLCHGGANIDLRGVRGDALKIARDRGHVKVIQFLEKLRS